MPEDNNNPNPQGAGDNQNPQNPQGNDPQKPESGEQGQLDLKSLPAEQLAQVLENPNFWKIDRITKLQEKAKQVETWEEEKKKQEEENLKKKGEFEQLAKAKEEEANTLKEQLKNEKLNNILTIEAGKAGAVDIGIVLKLIDRSGIQIGEDGTVAGAGEAVTRLLEAHPYLKGSGATPSIGTPSNPNDQAQGTRRFKLSQIKDPEFYRNNEKEIDKAMTLGLIEDDTPQG